jgi:hypothetical protein
MEHLELELSDLGDARIETKQRSPGVAYADSIYGWGTWPGFVDDCDG